MSYTISTGEMGIMLNSSEGCRRARRAEVPRQAMRYQLLQIVEELGLEAMVLADDLGRLLVQAGDPALGQVLAESAMWFEFAEGGEADELTVRRLQQLRPELQQRHVVARPVAVEVGGAAHVIGVGASELRVGGVERAARGIARICDVPQPVVTAAVVAAQAQAGQRRQSGVRWLIPSLTR